jgi:hypothetical protein
MPQILRRPWAPQHRKVGANREPNSTEKKWKNCHAGWVRQAGGYHVESHKYGVSNPPREREKLGTERPKIQNPPLRETASTSGNNASLMGTRPKPTSYPPPRHTILLSKQPLRDQVTLHKRERERLFWHVLGNSAIR